MDDIQQPLPVMCAPVLGGLAGAGASSDSHAEPPSHTFRSPESKVDMDQRLTSRFGRVIKPVCRLIESMAQLETLLGTEPVQSPVIDV